jgi:ribulose-phosphate 3-epimerase
VKSGINAGWIKSKSFMAEVVPAVLASSPQEFKQRLERVSFAPRVHLDFADGQFAPGKTIGLAQAYLPAAQVDLHLMLQSPAQQLETIISLKPHLVIIHAEADVDHEAFYASLRQLDIKTGLAVLPATTIPDVATIIEQVDHLLVFAGDLGHYGGQLQIDQLAKISAAKQIKPGLEVSVDGGVNANNAKQVAGAGADVLISGSFIQNAPSPKQAWQQLGELV